MSTFDHIVFLSGKYVSGLLMVLGALVLVGLLYALTHARKKQRPIPSVQPPQPPPITVPYDKQL